MNDIDPKQVNKKTKILSKFSLNSRYSLAGLLVIVIVTACAVVAIGYILYWNNPNRKYDLARGGESSENQVLNIEQTVDDRTSPVDAPDIKQKIEYLQKEITALKSIGDFNPNDVSNQNLQLVTPYQPSL